MHPAARPEGAVATRAVDEALVDDCLDRLTGGHPRHVEPLAELSIGRHPFVWPTFVGEGTEVFGDLLMSRSVRPCHRSPP